MANGGSILDWTGVPQWARIVAMIGVPSVFAMILLIFVLSFEDQKIQTLTSAINAASTQQHADESEGNKVLQQYIKTNEEANRATARANVLLKNLIAVAQQQCIIAAKGNQEKIRLCIESQVPLLPQDLPAY